MNPIRLKGLTPDEFERLCLELIQKLFHVSGMRRGCISDPDQGVDIEATVGSHSLGVQCKTGRLSVSILRDTLRQLIRFPHRIDRFILMCAQHPVPSAIDEFRQWASNAETTKGYIKIVELWDPDRIISELNKHPGLLEQVTQTSFGPIFAVPIARPNFKGHEAELAKLFESLRAGKETQVAVSIVGLGGIGKTTLATEYVYRFRDAYPGGVYWINGQEDIVAQCARFGSLAGVSGPNTDKAVAARTFLETRRRVGRSLIVLDNLDRPNLINQPIVNGLSLAECQSEVIITSRYSGLLAPGVSRLELATFTVSDSLALLARASNRPYLHESSSSEHMIAIELCRELGHLPLAINIAGSFLASDPQKSVSAFLEMLRSKGTLRGVDASDAEALRLSRPAEALLSASLNLAYESVQDDDAKQLFIVLCLLPEKLTVNKHMIPFILGQLENGQAKKTIAWLKNSGLIHIDDAGIIHLHSIVRSFGASILSEKNRAELAVSIGNSVKKGIVNALSPGNISKEKPKSLPKVFLCYAGPDRKHVEELYTNLINDGFLPWMDKKSLLPGQDWKLEIKRAIESSDFFVACISQHFKNRSYGHKEINLALDVLDMMPEDTIFLIPLRLEECPVDDRLRSRQWVDFFEPDGYSLLLQALNL